MIRLFFFHLCIKHLIILYTNLFNHKKTIKKDHEIKMQLQHCSEKFWALETIYNCFVYCRGWVVQTVTVKLIKSKVGLLVVFVSCVDEVIWSVLCFPWSSAFFLLSASSSLLFVCVGSSSALHICEILWIPSPSLKDQSCSNDDGYWLRSL